MRNTAKKATVRLSDIAKETGYSLSTVSKALNGRADVSEETRQTINAVLKRYGYSRKATSTKSQRIIEIVFQDFDNVWALEVLRGAIREAKLHDLNVITTEGGNRQHPDSSWIDNMLRRQTDGAILVFSSLTRIERNGGHMESVSDTLLRVRNANSVTIYVSIGTNFINYKDISGNARKTAQTYLKNAGKNYLKAKEAHCATYGKWFNRVSRSGQQCTSCQTDRCTGA